MSRLSVSFSPPRKYPAWQAHAAAPANSPRVSSRSPVQISTTTASPARLSSVPTTAARGSRVRRTNRIHATTTTGPMNSSINAMPTGSRCTARK
ncbi:MAG TPA: hypothetical protein VE172_09925 [Stackebrandtia sp.]|nr:hypothetical protein [Stackebrandtia sp.]HZE39114.1 hypothetical protein [Stackebrandtia sp.]